MAGSLAMMPAGQALAGPAAQLLGARTVLLAGGVIMIGISAALLSVPAVRTLRAVPRRAPARGEPSPGRGAATRDVNACARSRAEHRRRRVRAGDGRAPGRRRGAVGRCGTGAGSSRVLDSGSASVSCPLCGHGFRINEQNLANL
ncbi:hypothetical protein [Streptomyces sp. NPDC006925]|uniref:hypothetical protein n=1 Tax=Streptomyces sp. NPDC006925 TaxID=3364768 RepID=UPI0036A31157